MRSVFIAALILSWMPVIFFKPHIGVLVWSWISHMNPHKNVFGFAYDFPFLDLAAVCTFFGMLLARENRVPPGHPVLIALVAYYLWTVVTTLIGHNPNQSLGDFVNVSKMVAFAVLAMIIMQSPRRLDWYVMVMVGSLAFVTVAGAIFVVVTGGAARVQGAGGMIDDNNKLAMALAMVTPLMFYYFYHPPFRWVKWPAFLGALSFIISGIGTQSRGGLVAMAAGVVMVIAFSRKRLLFSAFAVPVVVLAINFAPDAWTARFSTTSDATTDESFVSRVVMWKFAHSLAKDYPIQGGGYDVFFNRRAQGLYMPLGHRAFEAHSVYYEVLGYHGYVGLFLFMTTVFGAFFIAGSQARRFEDYTETRHLATLCRMLQASMVAYCVGGLTIHLSQFDLIFNQLAIVVLAGVVGDKLLRLNPTPYVEPRQASAEAKPKFRPDRPAYAASERTRA